MPRRAYGFSRNRIATLLEDLTTTAGLWLEAADDLARAASSYRRCGAGFFDLMIVAAARRAGAETLSTFDRKVAQLEGATLLEDRVL